MVDMFLLLTVGHKISGFHNILTGLWYPSFSSGELRIESEYIYIHVSTCSRLVFYLNPYLLSFIFREETEIIEGEVVEIQIDRPASGTVSFLNK